jgi:N-acetylmuramoyl-L-alanine amidase
VAKKRLTKRIAAVVAGIAAALTGAALAAAAVNGAPETGVLKVRFGGDRAQTRVVIDLDRATTVAEPTFPAQGRMVMTFPKIGVEGAGQDGAGRGLVKRWLVDKAGGQARLQLDLDGDVTVAKRFLLPPGDGIDHWRYVIDLESSATTVVRPPAAALKILVKAPIAAPGLVKTPNLIKVTTASSIKRRRVIVIDAGHGGKDPGAQGANAREKDVTLAAAKALKARLEEGGLYRVVLTRGSDVYVPLEGRVQIARRADADLFISLHADAGADPTTRGASAYTLSETGADRFAKIFGADGMFVRTSGPGPDKAVGQILLDLTQRSTKNRSAAFAEVLLEKVGEETPLLRRSHRDAGFMVLLAPEVPAVLLEMGFITSPDDERLLTHADDRERLVNAVGDAIDAFFSQQIRLASR